MNEFDTIIIGGGITGSSAAFHLANKNNSKILLIEQQTISSGASGLTAGQIGSTGWGNIPDLSSYLTHGSLEIFKSLQLDLNYDIEFRQSGSLAAIQTKVQYDFVMDTVMKMKKVGKTVEILSTREARSIEPEISENFLGFVFYPLRAQADPVKSTVAFSDAAFKSGVQININEEVKNIVQNSDNTYNLQTSLNNYYCKNLILATGAWSNKLGKLLDLDIPIIPIRDQMWATKPISPRLFNTFSSLESSYAWHNDDGSDINTPPDLTHISGERKTRHLYGRQRKNGEVIFGGDREMLGFNNEVDFNGIESNKNHATEILPFLSELPISRTWAGFMPFSIDGEPIIGKIPTCKNLYIVSGLASSGFGRGPMSGKFIAECVDSGFVPEILNDADPGRFKQLAG